MVGALCVRSWSLCVSFHYVEGSRSSFGPYFLVPIGMAVALVWLEIGIAAGRRGIMTAASVVPLFLACLAVAQPPTDWVYQQFMGRFIHTLGGSPAYLTLLASVAFLACARPGAVPRALELMALALAGLAVVGPRTVYFANLVAPRTVPMAAAGLVLAALAWRQRDSRRALLSAVCLVIATTRGTVDFWPTADPWPIELHLGVLALMVVGALFDDVAGVISRGLGAFALLIMGLDASTGSPRVWSSMPHELIAWYPLVIAAAAWGFGLLVHDRFYHVPAASSLIGWLAHSGTQTYVQIRKVVVGLDQIAWGMLFFALAAAISLRKAGIWPRLSSKPYDPLPPRGRAPALRTDRGVFEINPDRAPITSVTRSSRRPQRPLEKPPSMMLHRLFSRLRRGPHIATAAAPWAPGRRRLQRDVPAEVSAGAVPGVTVVAAKRMTLPVVVNPIGTTRALEDVTIRARVKGFLKEKHFQDGGQVKAGQLLLVIDPIPYELQLKQYEAQLQAARAALAKAQSSKDPEVSRAQVELDRS